MSNLLIKSAGTQLKLSPDQPLEISHGALKLTLSFNGNGSFSLKQTGSEITTLDSKTPEKLVIGTAMPDGTIYAGISPDTGKAFYAAAQDAPGVRPWSAAKLYARVSEAHGYTNWRLPSASELDILFNNRVAIGSFDLCGEPDYGHYWSSSEFSSTFAKGQRFSDGKQGDCYKGNGARVRCVRG